MSKCYVDKSYYQKALTETKCMAFALQTVIDDADEFPNEQDRAQALAYLYRVLYYLIPDFPEEEVEKMRELTLGLANALERISKSGKVYLDKAMFLTHLGFKFGLEDLEA